MMGEANPSAVAAGGTEAAATNTLQGALNGALGKTEQAGGAALQQDTRGLSVIPAFGGFSSPECHPASPWGG